MSNAAKKILGVMKTIGEQSTVAPSQMIKLQIKSLSPLVFKRDDKIIIDNTFYTLDKNFSTNNLSVGDTVQAMVLNDNQNYYILGNTTSSQPGTSNYNNLTNKPQINGVTLSGNKSTSDLGINVPTKTSDLLNDSNFVADSNYVHTDNNYTNANKEKLTGVESGAEVNKIDTIKVNGTSQTITDKAVNINVPTKTSDLTNNSGFITKSVNDLTYYTLATDTGHSIELNVNSSTYVVTLNLKNSAGTTISTDTIDLPLESVVVSGSYDSATKEVVLTLQNGSTVRFSVADLVSGLQSEITSSNKLSSDLVDDTNHTNKFVTASEKTTWNNKQAQLTAGANITIDSNNEISATDTTYSNATTTTAGLMSSVDKIKLDNTFKELTSPVRIWDLDEGTYKLPENTVIYWYGASNTSSYYTTTSTGILFVVKQSTTYKQYYLFESSSSNIKFNGGYSTSSTGSLNGINLKNSYLTSISSYVKNNLTYNTSSTTYALSAYQGYLLNQNKEEVSNKVSSISSSSTDTEYPSAKCVYDELITKQSKFAEELTADIYLVDGTAPSLTLDKYYYTGTHNIYVNNTLVTDMNDSIFYIYYLTEENEYTIVKLFGKGHEHCFITYWEDAYTVVATNNLTTLSINTSIPSNPSALIQNTKVPSFKLFYDQLALKQATLTAGTNITIDANNEISATDTTYDNATTTTAGLMSGADKTKLDNVFKELTSPVRIWDLADGAYLLPQGCVVYYKGQTATDSFTITTSGQLFVTHYSTTYKNFYIFRGNTSSGRYITNGYSTSSTGNYVSFNLGTTYLSNISSYVKDNLTYSTSGTTYALSAYQGYLLNTNKENVSNKSTTISSSSTDTEYPSAKAVYDFHKTKEFIFATNTTGYTNAVTSEYQIVPISAEMSNGTLFTIENNEIKFTRNAKVKISFTTWLGTVAASGNKYIRLFLNNATTLYFTMVYCSATYREALPLTCCQEFSANDVISIRFYGAANDVISRYTYNLTIEEL